MMSDSILLRQAMKIKQKDTFCVVYSQRVKRTEMVCLNNVDNVIMSV